MARFNFYVVKSIDLNTGTYINRLNETVPFAPLEIYFVPVAQGEHESYVTDRAGVISKHRVGDGGGTGDYVPMNGMDFASGEHASGNYILSSFNLLDGVEPPNGFYHLANISEQMQTAAFRTSTIAPNQPVKTIGISSLSPNLVEQSSSFKDVNQTTIGASNKQRSDVTARWADIYRQVYTLINNVSSSIDISEKWSEVDKGLITWSYIEEGSVVKTFKFNKTGIFSDTYTPPATDTHYIQKGYINPATFISVLQSATEEEIATIKDILGVTGGSFNEATGYDLTLLDSQ